MIVSAALLSPVFISIFWTLVLFFQEQNKAQKPKIYLAVFMIVTFCIYCSHALFFSHEYNIYSLIESIYLVTMLSAYPLFYIYLVSLTNQKIEKKRLIIFFFPAVFFGSLSVIVTLFMSETERIFYVQDTLIAKNLKNLNFSTIEGIKGNIFLFSRLTFFIQIIYFAYRGVKLINTHDKHVGNYYSNVEGKTLNWAKNLIVAILVVAFSSAAFTIIGRSFFTKHELTLLIPSAIFSYVLFIIGLKGNEQIQVNEEIVDEIDPNVLLDTEKISQHDLLKLRLVQLFEREEIYKQPDLRITKVSELLQTNRTYISRLINEEFDMNFNEYVNKYRINDAKNLLKNISHYQYTMEHIAEKSGFGSTASFSRVFKELEGLTPGKFRAKQLNSNY